VKILETARKTVQKAAAAVAEAVTLGKRPRDPFYSDDERKAEINRRGDAIRAERAAAVDALLSGRSRWIPRRTGWLR